MLYDSINNPSSIDSPSLNELLEQKEYYNSDLKTQRMFVWLLERQRQLIISLFTNVRPSILTANVIGTEQRLVDGRQRFTTIIRFLENKFNFDEDTHLKIGNTEYDVSNMYFKDLPDTLKIKLLSQNVRIEKYINLTEDEEVNLMVRLNNGKAFSRVERSKLMNYGDINDFISQIKDTELFTRKIAITDKFKNTLLDEKLLLALFSIELGIEDVSLENVEEISKRIRNNNLLTEDTIDEILKVKWFNTTNFIPLYMTAKEFIEVSPRKMFSYLNGFFEIKDNEYTDIASEKWSSKKHINRRYEILKEYISNCVTEGLE